MRLYRPIWKGPDGKVMKSPYWHYDFIYHGQRYKGSTEKKSKPKAREVETDKGKEIREGNQGKEIIHLLGSHHSPLPGS